jgi:NADPH:quinone reductase-like Zn-dependent oxidoreductase
MKAIVYREFGPPDVLKCEEVEKPTPGDDEVLIRVRAASVNPLDWRMMRGGPYAVRALFGLYALATRKPKVKRPGVDLAGEVEAVGSGVTRFRPGDEVFGACRGAFAEYACGPESKLAAKPAGVTFEQAASAVVAGLTALQGLRDKGRIGPGQEVLINGAAGGVGTFAVQLAKSFGADVTGVCSAGNVEMVRSIGANHVVDYTHEDFTEGARRYDLILDCVGNHSLSACGRVLNPGGAYVGVGGKDVGTVLLRMLGAPLLSLLGSRKFVFFIAKLSEDDLTFLGGLIESGKVKPVIDRRYSLNETAEAVRYLEAGHARGKVMIIPRRDGEA